MRRIVAKSTAERVGERGVEECGVARQRGVAQPAIDERADDRIDRCAFGRLGRQHHRAQAPRARFRRPRRRSASFQVVGARSIPTIGRHGRMGARLASRGTGLPPDAFLSRPAIKLRDGRVEVRPARDGARVAVPVAADQRDQVDVAERARADEERRGDVDRLVAEALDQRGGRIGAFRQRGGDIAPRLDRDAVEERERQIFELGDLAARRPGERAECRDRGAKQAFGLRRVALDGDLPEIGNGHLRIRLNATR